MIFEVVIRVEGVPHRLWREYAWLAGPDHVVKGRRYGDLRVTTIEPWETSEGRVADVYLEGRVAARNQRHSVRKALRSIKELCMRECLVELQTVKVEENDGHSC